ncbi:MAG: copper homeostasis protein CutC [Flavobacteriales bacterium]|nr:MAG: copper homeostasis protein CutC [Flavobacteriales bacterium]
MIFEFCIDSIDGAIAAQQFGVKRVELCSALNVGGLTPSYGLIQQCAQYQTEVHVMIRHIEGGFVYSKKDIFIMVQDIKMAKQAGAKGVVFGCLTPDNKLDFESNINLIETAKDLNLEVTFHRAFDFVEDTSAALTSLINFGVDRILTSGQKDKAIEGIETIKELVQLANGGIEIMAGSGVNSSNAIELAKTGIDALHFTIHKSNNEIESLGMGNRTAIDEGKIKGILNRLSF